MLEFVDHIVPIAVLGMVGLNFFGHAIGKEYHVEGNWKTRLVDVFGGFGCALLAMLVTRL